MDTTSETKKKKLFKVLDWIRLGWVLFYAKYVMEIVINILIIIIIINNRYKIQFRDNQAIMVSFKWIRQ